MPDEVLGRDFRTQVAGAGTHIAVRELEPGACERIGELVGVFVEATRDLLVCGVEAQRKVRREHHRCVTLGRVVRIGYTVGTGVALGLPLVGACGALREFPLVAEQVLEVVVAPRRRRRRPCAFQTARNGVFARARAIRVCPAHALLFDAGCSGLTSDVLVRVGGTVALAKGVTTGDQGNGLFVVHRHTAERLADVARSSDGVGVTVRAFGVDVDQAHLHGGQRVF